MQNLPTSLAVLVAVAQTVLPGPRTTRSEPVLVRAVIDGGTLSVAAVGRVRLLGIEAPRAGRAFDTAAPFAREARERLESLVLNHWVRLEWDGPIASRSRPAGAYVMRDDGLFVNAEMVRSGFARVSGTKTLGRLDELARAEREAQAFRRGMWASGVATTPPGYTRPSTSRKRRS